jgi:putative phosphoribosyl transferase
MNYEEVKIKGDNNLVLEGHLSTDSFCKGWVIFAHGSGSSRKSSRNNWVAKELNKAGFSTFLFDLLTPEEDLIFENRFDIPILAKRLGFATDWLRESQFYHGEPMAFFGASTGAAAALTAVASLGSANDVYTVISRGGRPDLAGQDNLDKVFVPVLLLVGDLDYDVINLNLKAKDILEDVRMELIHGATHLFEEPGTLQLVVDSVKRWLDEKLPHENLGASL